MTAEPTHDARMGALALVARYYAAFNAADRNAMLALVTDDLLHEVNQGEMRHGRAAFAAFLAHMDRCYAERLEDLVTMADAEGRFAAATFTVHGVYRETDEGMPEACGRRYALPVGAFFTLREGRIARIATAYTLRDWLAQVSG